MKLAIVLLLCFVIGSRAVASAPREVAGFVLSRTDFIGNDLSRGVRWQFLLNADGTYTGLLQEEFAPRRPDSSLVSEILSIRVPHDGSWSYRVIDAETAELVLDGTRYEVAFGEDPLAGRFTFGRNSGLVTFRPYVAATRLVNVSSRAFVSPGRTVSVGFVLSEGQRRVLVRAIGPGLRRFGVTEPLEVPLLEVRRASDRLPVTIGLRWSSQISIQSAPPQSGAFPTTAINDRALLLTLNGGAYIAEVSGLNGGAGEVLIEVYQLP